MRKSFLFCSAAAKFAKCAAKSGTTCVDSNALESRLAAEEDIVEECLTGDVVLFLLLLLELFFFLLDLLFFSFSCALISASIA